MSWEWRARRSLSTSQVHAAHLFSDARPLALCNGAPRDQQVIDGEPGPDVPRCKQCIARVRAKGGKAARRLDASMRVWTWIHKRRPTGGDAREHLFTEWLERSRCGTAQASWESAPGRGQRCAKCESTEEARSEQTKESTTDEGSVEAARASGGAGPTWASLAGPPEHRDGAGGPADRSAQALGGDGARGVAARWAIWDTETRNRYIAVWYCSEQAARDALEDLLQPYPTGHKWRKRLRVGRDRPARRTNVRDVRPAGAAP